MRRKDHGADAGDDGHMAAVQQGQQFLCSAVKAHIPGHDHGDAAKLGIFTDAPADLLGRDGVECCLMRCCRRLDHPFCADDAVCLLQGGKCLMGHHGSCPRTDAYDKDILSRLPSEPAAQQGSGLAEGKPIVLGRSADNHQLAAGRLGGVNLIVHAPGVPGFLGDHVFGVDGAQGGEVHLLAEGTLHGDDMAGGQPC